MGRPFHQFSSRGQASRGRPGRRAHRAAGGPPRTAAMGRGRALTAACLLACAGHALAQTQATGPTPAAASAAGMLTPSAVAEASPPAAATTAMEVPVSQTPGGLVLGMGSGSRTWTHGTALRWSAETAARRDLLPALSIVTLPPEQTPGRAPGRAHHALSVRSEMPRQALRSLGLDVTECATRFRMPTRLRQDAPGGDTTLDAQAQVSWACRF